MDFVAGSFGQTLFVIQALSFLPGICFFPFFVHCYMRVFAFILLVAIGFSCRKKANETYNYLYHPASTDSTTPSRTDTAKTYLALGDSYTIGQSVSEKERFPAQTVTFIKQQGVRLADPVYIATTGWTTENLQTAIANSNPSAADVVSLLIGVNDQFQGKDTGGYAIRFSQLLGKAVQLAKGKRSNVFVLSIPDYSVTPFVSPDQKARVSMQIDWFNAINKRITFANGINYTDITPSTREAATNPALIAGDQLHPSGLEYKKWAEMLAPKIKVVIQ
jgi:lysophospholipase L1-like esterase